MSDPENAFVRRRPGRPPVYAEPRGKLNGTISVRLAQDVQHLARREGISFQALVERLLTEGMAELKAENEQAAHSESESPTK